MVAMPARSSRAPTVYAIHAMPPPAAGLAATSPAGGLSVATAPVSDGATSVGDGVAQDIRPSDGTALPAQTGDPLADGERAREDRPARAFGRAERVVAHLLEQARDGGDMCGRRPGQVVGDPVTPYSSTPGYDYQRSAPATGFRFTIPTR